MIFCLRIMITRNQLRWRGWSNLIRYDSLVLLMIPSVNMLSNLYLSSWWNGYSDLHIKFTFFPKLSFIDNSLCVYQNICILKILKEWMEICSWAFIWHHWLLMADSDLSSSFLFYSRLANFFVISKCLMYILHVTKLTRLRF